MKILKEIISPNETTYALARFWPLMGGFGAAGLILLPAPFGIILFVILMGVASTISIRGAITLPVDEETIKTRINNPPRFNLAIFIFSILLPILSFSVLAFSTKYFAMAFSFLSSFSLILFGMFDPSTKRVLLASLPNILISITLLAIYSSKSIFLFFIMLAIFIPKTIEECIKNKKLFAEIEKANKLINQTENTSVQI